MPAFLFSDIEGSTRLWEEHPAVMSGALARHNEIIRGVVAECGGQIVKSTGDGFLVLYESGNPLACAVAIQIAIQEESWPEQIGELRIRIGIHSGEFETRGSDIYGSDVNRAARVMDAGWGGQILITDSAKIDYKLPEGTSLQNLGAHLLKDLHEPQPLFGLVHPKLRQNFPPPRTLSSQPNNLPILPTAFIGRKEEIKAIGELLRTNTCQMITLHGSGGIGKTRLSIEAAMTFLKYYPFGAFFVPLAPIDDPEDIWPAIASAINLPIYEDRLPKEQVLKYLQQKEMLLVIDNFEHLQNGARFVGELLDASPKLQVLVTSRTRLQLQKECIFEVNGLQFPERADAQIFEDFEAVQLFTSMAQRADPNFELSPEDYPAIAEICTLMDGMPLGIELAAYWVRIISPQEIVDELREDIDLLKTELVDVPERHRSMRAMFDYSWKLLDEKEKLVLQAMSVFRGGCTLAAAKAVAGASLRVLSGLVDKSLVKRTEHGRYEMHELIRQLAEEKLRADEEALGKTLEAHCRYYLTFLAEQEGNLKGEDQINALNALDADFENLRLAWLSAVESGQADLVGDALESYFWMLTYRNHHKAGRELFERARQKWSDPDANPILYHRLRVRFLNKNQNPETVYQAAVDSARERDAKFELAVALNLAGRYVGHQLNEHEHGLAHMEEALHNFEALGDDFYIGHVLDDISFNYITNLEERIEYAEKSLAVRERSGDLFGKAGVLGNLVVGFFWAARLDEVEELIDEALEIAQQTNDIRNIGWLYIYRAEARLFQGKFDEAMEIIQEAAAITQDIEDRDLNIQIQINTAVVIAMRDEDYLQAKQIIENTVPLDAEFSMHSGNAQMTYGIVAAGLKDIETMKKVATFPFKITGMVDRGETGLNWFVPIIIALLYYTQHYTAAAECIGYTKSQNVDSWMKEWAFANQIERELREVLEENAYEEAVSRGKKLKFEDIQKYFEHIEA